MIRKGGGPPSYARKGTHPSPSPLAHWTYQDEMARGSVERENREYQERTRAIVMVICGMLVVAVLLILIFVEEGGVETGLFLPAVAAFLFVVSRLTPWLECRRALQVSHDAVITELDIVYEGSVYPFRSFLVFRDGVSFQKAGKKSPPALVSLFTRLVGRFILQPFDVVVPVPPGEEERATQIVQELSGRI
jgi:hypothetical protein